MQIIVLKNDWKCLILGTNTDKLYSFVKLGDSQAIVHPSCNLYLLSYYCPINPSYTNMFNHYMYLAVEDRKSENPYVGHVLSDKLNTYHYVKEAGSAKQLKEKDVKKVGTASEEGTLIKSTVEKATEISKDDSKTIQNEKDAQKEAPNAACLFNNCEDVKVLSSAFNNKFRNLFIISVHEILWSAFECIASDSLLKSSIKESPLMKVALMVSIRIEVEFNQGPSMNGINFKIVGKCCGKNVFNNPNDNNEDFVSFFATLENAMLSLLIACHYHRLKSVVLYDNARNS